MNTRLPQTSTSEWSCVSLHSTVSRTMSARAKRPARRRALLTRIQPSSHPQALCRHRVLPAHLIAVRSFAFTHLPARGTPCLTRARVSATAVATNHTQTPGSDPTVLGRCRRAIASRLSVTRGGTTTASPPSADDFSKTCWKSGILDNVAVSAVRANFGPCSVVVRHCVADSW